MFELAIAGQSMGHPPNVRASAVEYMRRQLGQGKSLAKALLETVDFEEGKILTSYPTPASPIEAEQQFKWGHLWGHSVQTQPEQVKIAGAYYVAFPVAKAREQLVEMIRDLLRDTERVCLLENYLAEAHDGWLQRAKSRIVTHGNEVYHVLVSADHDKAKIEAAIREWDHLPTSIGALGGMNEEVSVHIAAAKTITTGELAAFAETVWSVFVGAYDGEGYIVWNKRSG